MRRQIRVACPDLLLVRRGIRHHRRHQAAQRADLAAIEAGENRHLRLLPAIEHIHDLTGKDVTVDHEERKEPRARGDRGQRLGIHRTQSGEIGRACLLCQRQARRLRRHAAERCGAQLRRGHHVRALRDGLGEQAARLARRHEVHDTQPARRLARDRDIRGSPPNAAMLRFTQRKAAIWSSSP